MPTITLRTVQDTDLPHFFQHQLDESANQMAAFTSGEPENHAGFMAHWTKIRTHPSVVIRTIVCEDTVAGYILVHDWFGDPEVSYWIDRAYWGRGVATEALRQFLGIVTNRPIFGRTAADNVGSQRVLEKCGFQLTRHERGYANARNAEIDETVYKLDCSYSGSQDVRFSAEAF